MFPATPPPTNPRPAPISPPMAAPGTAPTPPKNAPAAPPISAPVAAPAIAPATPPTCVAVALPPLVPTAPPEVATASFLCLLEAPAPGNKLVKSSTTSARVLSALVAGFTPILTKSCMFCMEFCCANLRSI